MVAANEDPYIVGYVNRVQSISYAANGAAALAQAGASAMTTPRTGTVGTGSNTYSPRSDFIQGQQISRSNADDFYRSAGYTEEQIASHVKGIDFSKPVVAATLPKGTIAVQYVAPNGRVGNYFAPPGTPASELGFYSGGRVLTTFVASQNVVVLKSTAASIVDNWSFSQTTGWKVQTRGGGTQYFSPNNSAWRTR